jgi:hypothetical protein
MTATKPLLFTPWHSRRDLEVSLRRLQHTRAALTRQTGPQAAEARVLLDGVERELLSRARAMSRANERLRQAREACELRRRQRAQLDGVLGVVIAAGTEETAGSDAQVLHGRYASIVASVLTTAREITLAHEASQSELATARHAEHRAMCALSAALFHARSRIAAARALLAHRGLQLPVGALAPQVHHAPN